MKQGWKIKKLGDVSDIKTGKSNAVDADVNGKFTFFDRSKKIKKSNRYLFDCEALIIPGEGSQFFPRYYSGKFDLHQRVYSISNFHKSVNIRFVEYFLIFNHKHFENVAVGATVKSLRLRHFTEIEIPLPSLTEQKRIVAILDKSFTAIATAKENAQQNLQNAKELFESYLQNVFENNKWEGKTLEQISDVFGRGKSKHRPRNDKKLFGGDYPFIQTGDIRNSEHCVTNYSQTYNEVGLSQSKLWPKGTICITIAANIAETGVLSFEACFPDSVIGIVVNKELADIDFVEYLLQSFKVNLQALSKGSAQDNINLGTFKDKLFPFPPVKKQQQIVKKLNSLSAETKKLEGIYQQKINDLEELKKSVLEKAFKGELKMVN